jgi:1-aminocyclopropane-1-carboxylate deaminase/D-cysteine desulfhydrase-like pyridoxal-dependent ACC family enzyme
MLDFEKILHLPSPLEPLFDSEFDKKALKVYIKRDDLIHPQISGNKWRKLKHQLKFAKEAGYKQIVSFGGAYSNHIYALAAAGKYLNLQTIGIIRGEELNKESSKTLQFANQCGMQLYFVSREKYRKLRVNHHLIHEIAPSLKDSLIIPEGGTTPLALNGVGEMVDEIRQQLGYEPDYIICPVGTGGTIAGILSKASEKTTVIGICVLKNGFYLDNEIKNLLGSKSLAIRDNSEIFWEFHQGGYAKKTPQLLKFIEEFHEKTKIQIEPVYSGKMFFAFFESIINQIPVNSTVVFIHTGGIQPN